MNIVKLSTSVSVAAQIRPDDVAEIVARGYKVLVNNRPDGEEGDQPTDTQIAAAAIAVGIEYYHLPVTATDFPGPGFEQMSDLLDDPGSPVLAFCRTGTRCTNLWVASREAPDLEQAEAIAQQLGYNLGMAEAYLDRR
jgi:uncharacterized protein (TIGR01244 family)